MTENDDGKQFDLIEGQLIPHGIPVVIASSVSRLAAEGRWAKAFELLQNYPTGCRILSRVWGIRHE